MSVILSVCCHLMRTVDILYVYLYACLVYLCLFACCVFMGLAAWNKMDDDDDDEYLHVTVLRFCCFLTGKTHSRDDL